MHGNLLQQQQQQLAAAAAAGCSLALLLLLLLLWARTAHPARRRLRQQPPSLWARPVPCCCVFVAPATSWRLDESHYRRPRRVSSVPAVNLKEVETGR